MTSTLLGSHLLGEQMHWKLLESYFSLASSASAQSIALNGGGLRRTVTKLDAMTAQWVDDPVAADYRARQLLERSTPKDIKSRSRRAI